MSLCSVENRRNKHQQKQKKKIQTPKNVTAKKLLWFSERLTFLGIKGDQLRAPFKPSIAGIKGNQLRAPFKPSIAGIKRAQLRVP